MFSDPEAAVTGMTLQEATLAGHDADTASFPFSASGRARTMGRVQGAVQWAYERSSGILLGAQITGAHASEIVGEATWPLRWVRHSRMSQPPFIHIQPWGKRWLRLRGWAWDGRFTFRNAVEAQK
jgi:pyruvate/2-oxoglutarate dehydrogenase complex dihydrolipoamide dehydrogenase (E3) component